MRIVIEIDGDDVQVHTDRQARETGSANVVDAGSAPMDLLRQHGEIADSADEGGGAPLLPLGKQGAIKPVKGGPLNPLRAGQAIARGLQRGGVESNAESAEVVDGGGAPRLSKISGKEKPPRGNAPRQRGRKK